MIRSTRHWTREEPVSFGIETERLPFPQFENEAPFDWNLVLRIVVRPKGGEGLGNRFVQHLRRHVERVLCLVQVMDDDGTSLERHKRNLTYSLFLRLQDSGMVWHRHNKIKMVQPNRIINVRRNSINTVQRNQIMETRSLKETGHGHTS